MGFKILAINPGSTSTKVALYDEERPLLDLTLRHSAEQIAHYPNIIDQLDWRRDMILTALKEHGFDIMSLAAVIGRGGLIKPIPAGVYEVNDAMRRDLQHATMEHASNLGGLLADGIAATAGIKAYIADPVVVDEMDDIARLSGHPDCPRRSIFHALNQKATARLHCDRIGIVYEKANLVVAHLGGSRRYVLPVTVTSCNGVDLLDSRSTVYFVARQGAMINVVANIAWMNFPVSWSADAKPLVSGMKQVTIEALLRSADWTDGRGDALSSVFGIEGNFLVRIGDADRPRDQLQLATGSANGGNWPAANAAPGLPVNEWVHIAVVWDAVNGERIYYQNGKQVAYSNQKMSGSVTLTGNCYVGKSYNEERYIPGEISELRVWSVARTPEQIAGNMYGVSPESEGLVAYWKFNEGSGSTIIDHANGTNLSAVGGTPTWIPVTLPEIK